MWICNGSVSRSGVRLRSGWRNCGKTVWFRVRAAFVANLIDGSRMTRSFSWVRGAGTMAVNPYSDKSVVATGAMMFQFGMGF